MNIYYVLTYFPVLQLQYPYPPLNLSILGLVLKLEKRRFTVPTTSEKISLSALICSFN